MKLFNARPAAVTPITVAELARVIDSAVLFGSQGVDKDPVVTGVTHDSRLVQPGDIFGAFPGENVHGASFSNAVAEQGAVAILTDISGSEMARQTGLPVIVSAAPRHDLAILAALVYGAPSSQIPVVGITGTNGKTTTSYLLDHILGTQFPVRGLFGTVAIRLGDQEFPADRTTLEAASWQAALAKLVADGGQIAVAEVSSQAIDLERVTGTFFQLAVFTNLQYEHLDYHGTMADYYAAKQRLFEPGTSARAVILVDDEWGKKLAEEAQIPVTTISTKLELNRLKNSDTDWWVEHVAVTPQQGMSFVLRSASQYLEVEIPLPGHYNVSNAAAALVSAITLGVPAHAAVERIRTAPQIPGRSEIVFPRSAAGPLGVVDYAHTPDGLAAVLAGMRLYTPGRIIVVFGCDGHRDDSKRPGLGRAAATHADVVIVTDENPRHEDAQYIRDRILLGVTEVRPSGAGVLEISPRSLAVETALRLATPEDTVIVTGKGHETTQEVAGVVTPYADQAVLKEVQSKLELEAVITEIAARNSGGQA